MVTETMTRQDSVREPVQERSQKRVEAILDAARRIIENKGAAKMKMSDIADEASFSVGSIYQYFPNKSAIIAALAERILEANTHQNEQVLAAPPRSLVHLSHITTELLEQYYELQMQAPVVKDIWAAFNADKELQDLQDVEHDDDVQNRDYIFEISKHLFDPSKHEEAKRALLIIIKFGAAAVGIASQQNRKEADAYMEDAKIMLYAAWEASVLPLGAKSQT